MKRKLGLLLIITAIGLSGIAQFQDNFSDGNITVNPTWEGDDSLFIVNANNELQLADSNLSNSTTYLSTASKAISNATWVFKFKCDFPPSSSNFAEVHLVSDIADVTGNNTGYYVQIGSEAGTTDKVTLYKSTNGSKRSVIAGRVGTVGSNPEGWIKVTRDSLGNWELFLDTSATKTGYVSEGTALDTDHITSEYFGIQCKYTSGRRYLFYFDSISVTGTFYTDTIKPFISNTKVESANDLVINFSEKIDPATGLNQANYVVSNGVGVPASLNYQGTDSSVIELSFSNAFSSGTNYQLFVSSVEDRNGNVITNVTENFKYIKLDTAANGDVQINEIMADPNPPVALPTNIDWVEIYNSSSKTFSLKGWTFWDKTSSTRDTLPDELLAPGEYAVLCDKADSADLAPFSGRLILMEGFPALNVDDEIVTLRNQFGDIIDQVNYFRSWYGSEDKEDGGYTLEKINPNHPCSGSSNWTGSESLNGGTPGTQNSVYNTAPETDRPTLTSAQIIDINTIEVSFSKKLDSLSLVNATVSGLSVSRVLVPNALSEKVTLLLNNPIETGVVYNLSISGAADCFGNQITNDTLTIGIGKTPLIHQVVINEIFPIPDVELNNKFDAEFIELYNNTTSLIGLDSCFFSDLSSDASLSGAIIKPNDYLVLCERSAVSALSDYGNVWGVSSWPSLNNTGDVLTLTCKNAQVHQVAYDDDWYQEEDKKDGGWSLEQIDPNNPCGEQLNWKGSLGSEKATPGKANSVLGVLQDKEAPEILSANAINDSTLRVSFNENISLSNFTNTALDISPVVSANIDSLQDNYTLILSLKNKLKTRTIYTLTINGMLDCVGNELINGTITFGLPEKGEAKDVVINELLFDPKATANTDFIEIYNNSEKIIDLKGWYLADFDNNKDTLDGFQLISETERALLPGEFAVINKDNVDLLKHYPTHNEKTFIQITSMPSYPNDEGTAVLLNDSAVVIDRLAYFADMHHVIIKDPEGVSLERLDYNRPTIDETNWHSAAENVGFATPGVKNSQYLVSEIFEAQVTLESKTFSPDNDGFDDVLNINYEFSESGYVANIEIMDTEGTLVYTLTQNELLSTKGTLSWNGQTDRNSKARAGMYIIYFEIFNQQGESQHFKKVCVLALKF